MYRIYIVRNRVNGKVYIGQTYRSIKTRWQEHWRQRKDGTYFHQALMKYGTHNFTVRKIATAENGSLADLLEMIYIHMYKSTNPSLGYNRTEGGSGTKGPMRPEHRAKLIAARRRLVNFKPMLGVKQTQEAKDKIRDAFTRHDVTDEECRELYLSGKTVAEIANTLGTSKTTVYKRIKGVPRHRISRRSRLDISNQEVRELRSKGATLEELASRYRCSVQTIRRIVGIIKYHSEGARDLCLTQK